MNKVDKTNTIIRIMGNEYYFNDNDRDFVKEILAEKLNLPSVAVIDTGYVSKHTYSVVVIDSTSLDKMENASDVQIELMLMELVDAALPHQHGFITDYTDSGYQVLRQERLKERPLYLLSSYRR